MDIYVLRTVYDLEIVGLFSSLSLTLQARARHAKRKKNALYDYKIDKTIIDKTKNPRPI